MDQLKKVDYICDFLNNIRKQRNEGKPFRLSNLQCAMEILLRDSWIFRISAMCNGTTNLVWIKFPDAILYFTFLGSYFKNETSHGSLVHGHWWNYSERQRGLYANDNYKTKRFDWSGYRKIWPTTWKARLWTCQSKYVQGICFYVENSSKTSDIVPINVLSWSIKVINFWYSPDVMTF